MTVKLITQEEKTLAVVTPTSSSPTKRRRTNSNDVNINDDLEKENEANRISKMINLKWDEFQNMETAEIKKFVQAYAATKEFNTLDGFFDTHSIDEQRENLIECTIELLAEYRPSTIHAETSDDFINNLDQLTAYFEYYLAFVLESDDNEASRALVQEISTVRKELKGVRDNLKNYHNEAMLTWDDKVNSVFEMSDEDVDDNIMGMAILEWDEIYEMEDTKIRNYLTAYSIRYEYPISEAFFYRNTYRG